MKRMIAAAAALGTLVLAFGARGIAQRPPTLAIRTPSVEALRTWDRYIAQRERAGAFRLRRADVDPSLPSRQVERLQQYHRGVRIWGAEVVRDAEQGVPVTLIGEAAPDLTIGTVPALSARAASDRVTDVAGAGTALLRPPELIILPLQSGDHRLAYTAVVSRGSEVLRLFVDAQTGAELLRHSEIQTQSAVGSGHGVFGSAKKMSVVAEAGTYFADDRLRPPSLQTFDMRGDTNRSIAVAFLGAPLSASDRASDSDNNWSDPSAVDAHAHIGWTYDYFYKRHGRRGLDGNDRPIVALINAVPAGVFSVPPGFEFFVDNAFWCGECGPEGIGVMFFGNGVPPTVYNTFTGQTVAPLAGAIDVAAHELTHGVVEYTAQLLPFGEPGALNEGFADIMGTSVEFFYHPTGSGRGTADYVIGEDSFLPFLAGVPSGIRSLANPAQHGYPDHYSGRFTGEGDNGGVHINAGIPGHAFYLAIEGGTNRTSGLAVQGVGGANREQIEKVFYRAFVFLMPPNATFATARAATIQAARDLYGAGSAPERAVTEAWTAVGVN